MSRRIGNTVVIERENSQQCDLCGKIAELRPYGPQGECICYECGRALEPITSIMLGRRLFGDRATLENMYGYILKWAMEP